MGLFGKKKKAAKDAPAPAAEAAAAPSGQPPAEISDELVAVIAAAISAYEAEQFNQTLYIRKLDRTAGVRPAWGVAGMQEAIDMRRM